MASTLTTPSNGAPTSAARRVSDLAMDLEQRMAESVNRISELNSETRIVALNARLEAARLGGSHGGAFDVVAKAIQNISLKTAQVAEHLMAEFRVVLSEMRDLNEELATRARGDRLSDVALANIDIIDRNLYERSCDVRWWATDQSVVDALDNPTPQTLSHCTSRLGQILDSYTVYFDIIVVDVNGRVLANGRPNQYRVVGDSQADQTWFNDALLTQNGTEFVQSSVHSSSLCRGDRTIIYACTVRSGGRAHGEPLGVLAVVFRWDALAQVIVERTPLTKQEWEHSRACIVNSHGMILADSANEFGARLTLDCLPDVLRSNRGYRMQPVDGAMHCIGHAKSPGFETYQTGWHSLVIQNSEVS